MGDITLSHLGINLHRALQQTAHAHVRRAATEDAA